MKNRDYTKLMEKSQSARRVLTHSPWAQTYENKLSGTFSAAAPYVELGDDEVKQWN